MAMATARIFHTSEVQASAQTAHMWGFKVAGARVAGAATSDAEVMPELNPVPLGRCRGPWRERR